MTKKTKRIAWIAGLTGGAAAVIGAVAYAVSKSSSSSSKTTSLPPRGTAPKEVSTSTPSWTPIQIHTTPPPTTSPWPGTPQFVNLVPGQDTTVQALAGLLTIRLPAGLLRVNAISNDNGGANPTFNPPSMTGPTATQSGATITMPIAGISGATIVVSGYQVGPVSAEWATTISVQ